MNGMAFDLSTPHGRMMVTIIAGIAEFERELIQERIRSGIATLRRRAASARVPARAEAEIRSTTVGYRPDPVEPPADGQC